MEERQRRNSDDYADDKPRFGNSYEEAPQIR